MPKLYITLPRMLWKDGDDYPQHEWGADVDISSTKKNNADTYNKAFVIHYSQIQNIPEDVCIELVTHDWKNLGDVVIAVWFGPDFFARTPFSLDDAVAMCRYFPEFDGAGLEFTFDIDTNDAYWREHLENCAPSNGGC